MLRFRRSSINGVQDLIFNHGFRQISLYSTSISTEVNPNLVNYLVENLGFSNKKAVSISSKFTYNRQLRGGTNTSNCKFIENFDSVIRYFNKIGLQNSQIQNAVSKEPLILMCSVDKTLIPKTEALLKLGFSESDIAEVVTVNPKIYLMGLNSSILPAFQALKELTGSELHVISILKKAHRLRLLAIPKLMVPNVALLRSYGVPVQSICKSLHNEPFAFLRNTEDFKDAMFRVEDSLGIPRSSLQFITGVSVLSHLREEGVELKKQLYKSFGWGDSDFARLVRLCPQLLAFADDKIKKKLDFLINELGYTPHYLASNNKLFTCSLEKRVVPRHKVLLVLKENGLVTRYSLITVVGYTDSKFLNKFVLPFKEVHEVYSKLAGINLETLTLRSSNPNSSAL